MLNEALARRNPCAAIPGMPRNHNDDEVTGELKLAMDQLGIPYDDLADPDEIPLSLDSALESAKALAQARCRTHSCGCCMNVRILITCDAAASLAELPQTPDDPRRWRTSGRPKCGKSTTLDCRTGNFTILQ
jgi:hypothetical protein